MYKKIIMIIIFIGFVSFSVSIPFSAETIQNQTPTLTPLSSTMTQPTFAEYATTTWCPQCPDASEALYEIHTDGIYPINYVSLVSDVNQNAKDRTSQYFTVAIPTVYFDGGYVNFVGNGGSIPATKQAYIDIIEDISNREIKQSISPQTQVTFQEPDLLSIAVTIENTGDQFFIGFLKTYITEITSRWNDFDGNPYHFALLDFAFNEFLFLPPNAEKTFEMQWVGGEDHNGITFEDITIDNIDVKTAVFHWVPHLMKGYESNQFTQYYPAFYCVASDNALPN